MRIFLISLIAFLLFEPPPIGCSYFTRKVPENAYPETVGRFSREYVLHGGQREIATKYVDPRRPNQHSIGMELSLGDFLDSSLAKCSAENLEKSIYGGRQVKTAELKDRSGKRIGEVRACRDREQDSDNFYIEMTHGDVSFFIRTNNLKGEVERSEALSLKDIVEFTKAIPFNSDIDLEGLEP